MTRRPTTRLHPAALAVALAITAPGATATDYPSSDYLLGDWGARDTWKGHGISIGLNWTAEPMANVSGGEVLGGTYADNIALDVSFDLQRLLSIPATRVP